ncbi:MAG: hypothetical protein OJF51_003198 [Nitrospira sp.]|nr:MAG: hypothetical protein OJF51_003198 [Nitrospira sp.]
MMVNEPENLLGTLPMPGSLSMLCAKIRVFVGEAIPAKNHGRHFLAIRSA